MGQRCGQLGRVRRRAGVEKTELIGICFSGGHVRGAVGGFDYDDSHRGYRLTEPTYNLPPLRLRPREIYSFFVARKLLEGFAGTPLELGMRSVLAKIGESLQGFISTDLESVTDQFSVLMEDYAQIDPGHWEMAARCLNRRERLQAVYQRFDGKVGEYRLEPLHLALYHGNWYLLVRNVHANRVEIFALSRFRELAGNGERFQPSSDFDPGKFLRQGFGISRAETPVQVRLRFTPAVATYIKERFWHASQELHPQPDGSVEMQLEIVGHKELIRWILSWMPEVVVLSPHALRMRVLSMMKTGTIRNDRNGHE